MCIASFPKLSHPAAYRHGQATAFALLTSPPERDRRAFDINSLESNQMLKVLRLVRGSSAAVAATR
jgi:hypothetical protein